jgi:alpha-glucosidase
VERWWQGAVGYQVYVRSFADGDGDGVGDLPGVRSKLDHLEDLGVDVIWLTPFYRSPQRDHGYDVSDHLEVDPLFGDLDDLTALVDDAHARGMRVVIDLVPNHTSDQHPWFQDALTGRDATHRDRYVWRDGHPDGGPPNNWVSHFGGPAWSYHAPTDQWWMHLFLPEQPDLDWADPIVRAEFERILETWFERGVDGFRIDVAHSLVEHPEFLDNPLKGDPPPPDASPAEVFAAYDHVHDLDQGDVLEVYRAWNDIATRHGAVLIGEVYLLEPEAVARYVRDQDALHLAFCFPALHTSWDPVDIRTTLETSATAGGHHFAWPLSSHDDPHAATRFGGGEVGARRALAYFTFLCGLPGVPFLYQGDELGLDDGVTDAHEDPISVRNPGAIGRDGSRTPVTWSPGPGFGFTTGEPWLPFGDNRDDSRTAAAQQGDPASPLERTRALLRVRRQLDDLTSPTDATWLSLDGPLVGVARGAAAVVLHVAADPDDAPAEVSVGPDAHLAYASVDGTHLDDGVLHLPADGAAIVTGARFDDARFDGAAGADA